MSLILRRVDSRRDMQLDNLNERSSRTEHDVGAFLRLDSRQKQMRSFYAGIDGHCELYVSINGATHRMSELLVSLECVYGVFVYTSESFHFNSTVKLSIRQKRGKIELLY